MKKITPFIIFLIFIIFAQIFNFEIGQSISRNFIKFTVAMLKILPAAFILIGLFEVWIKRQTIEKHLGENSNWRGYFWAILLSTTTVGGIYISFPIAAVLYNKGAKLSIIFTYIGAAAVCRVPMTIFEASFLGMKFTLIRLFVSLPLIIISSLMLEKIMIYKKLKIKE
ncbi:MAG: hypothetical protein HN952_05210 [Candidatus Cloacimonetes bacterium]|jgi:uncharacterized membrane protein YraQ (UPF0718 family)|nr:hypothetical protein [Candidatus Cloacimonadota bacterium]MBT6994339.1 hypothetical protein [Candidatus Cloacimonadota bacterium]MBT7469293.1 hypothetical protein [Candidatus Cloacimonadota bacterium]